MKLLSATDSVTLVASGVLALEFALHGAAMLARLEQGIAPIEKHLGFRPDAGTLVALGLFDLAVAGGFVIGMKSPSAAIAASTYSTALFGGLTAIRLQKKLGTVANPPDFPIFLALSLTVLLRNVARA